MIKELRQPRVKNAEELLTLTYGLLAILLLGIRHTVRNVLCFLGGVNFLAHALSQEADAVNDIDEGIFIGQSHTRYLPIAMLK